jgi:hypothetical protein
MRPASARPARTHRLERALAARDEDAMRHRPVPPTRCASLHRRRVVEHLWGAEQTQRVAICRNTTASDPPRPQRIATLGRPWQRPKLGWSGGELSGVLVGGELDRWLPGEVGPTGCLREVNLWSSAT